MDQTIGQLIASVLGPAWVQWALVAVTVGSVAVDQRERLKTIPAKLSAWWTARRAGKTAPAATKAGCEQRRLTLIGVRHTASELKDPAKRTAALALCDQFDELAATLYPEAA